MSQSLETFAIPAIPGAYYIPNFLQEDLVSEYIPDAKKLPYMSRYYGITGEDGPELSIFSKKKPNQQPKFLSEVVKKLDESNLMGGNLFQITVNHYKDATRRIVSHKDGNGYQVAIVSLGPSHTVLHFHDHPEDMMHITRTTTYPMDNEENIIASLWMEPCSCLILRKEAYLRYSHAIIPHSADQVRFSADDVKDKDGASIGAYVISNGHLLTVKNNQIVPRGERLSLAIWAR